MSRGLGDVYKRQVVVHPAERQGRGKDRNVAWVQAIHRLLVSIEPDVPTVFRYIYLVGEVVFQLGLEAVVTVLQFVLEDVGHRDQFGCSLVDPQSVHGRTGTTTTAANEGDLDCIVLSSVHVWNGQANQSRGGSHAT